MHYDKALSTAIAAGLIVVLCASACEKSAPPTPPATPTAKSKQDPQKPEKDYAEELHQNREAAETGDHREVADIALQGGRGRAQGGRAGAPCGQASARQAQVQAEEEAEAHEESAGGFGRGRASARRPGSVARGGAPALVHECAFEAPRLAAAADFEPEFGMLLPGRLHDVDRDSGP